MEGNPSSLNEVLGKWYSLTIEPSLSRENSSTLLFKDTSS